MSENSYKYRTQLYLDEERYLFLKESAARYGSSIADVVRRLIDKEMGAGEPTSQADPLFRLAERPVKTGRRDGSVRHDRYIYGQVSGREQHQEDKHRENGQEGGDPRP